MITVENTSKRMIVLKAIGKKVLRLFPGHNFVEEPDLNDYTKGNPVVKAIVKESLRFVSEEFTNTEEALESKKKNDDLNKIPRPAELNGVQASVEDAESSRIAVFSVMSWGTCRAKARVCLSTHY